MSVHALAIHPAPPDWIPDVTFAPFLREIGFLGDRFDVRGEDVYRAGRRFFDHIVFGRSHSVIVVSGMTHSPPRDSRELCQIELETDKQTGFYGGENLLDPLCPDCAATIDDWPRMLGDWFEQRIDWTCPACGRSAPAGDVDWQQNAGVLRFHIKVRQIIVGEAAPSAEFVEALQQKTSCAWRYFWYHL